MLFYFILYPGHFEILYIVKISILHIKFFAKNVFFFLSGLLLNLENELNSFVEDLQTAINASNQ